MLHRCALLQKSFQPENDIRTLRTYVCQRKKLVTICSDSIRRMQKAMELMNIKTHTVISDIMGKTGLQIIQAILKGKREPEEFLKDKGLVVIAGRSNLRWGCNQFGREKKVPAKKMSSNIPSGLHCLLLQVSTWPLLKE